MNAQAIPGTNEAMSVHGYLSWPASPPLEMSAEERGERPGSEADAPSGNAAEDLAMEVYGY